MTDEKKETTAKKKAAPKKEAEKVGAVPVHGYQKEIVASLICQSMNDGKLIFKLKEEFGDNEQPVLLSFDKFTMDKKMFPEDVEPQGFDVSGVVVITIIATPKKAS